MAKSKETLTTEIARKAAETVVDNLIKDAFRAIVTINGVPAAYAGPFEKLYSEYAKTMLKLLETEVDYGKHLESTERLSTVTESLEKNNAFLKEQLTKIKARQPGPAGLLLSLSDPRIAAQAKQDNVNFKNSLTKLIDMIDGVVGGNRNVLDKVVEKLYSIDDFLGVSPKRNVFDIVLGSKTLGVKRNDLCWQGMSLLESMNKLIVARNELVNFTVRPKMPTLRVWQIAEGCLNELSTKRRKGDAK